MYPRVASQPRTLAALAFAAALATALALLAVDCATPTALDVSVYSELPCGKGSPVVFVGGSALTELGGKAPSAVSTKCGADGLMGDVVLVPSAGSRQGVFAVMQRDDGQPADGCLDPAQASHCIVAKRQWRFLSETTSTMRVDLRASCLGVVCPDTQTCVRGGCVDVPIACGAASSETCLSDAGAKTCPSGRGPDMVAVNGNGTVPSFCVDATEVTNAQFSAFLATSPSTSSLPPECSFKGGFATPPGVDQRPVNVDWCDAYAFCAWAGKRLCGKVGGGANDFGDFAVASKSQWYYACSHGGQLTFPYGNAFDGTACNDEAYDAGATVAVGSAPSCVGGFPGLHDMAGNYWEWEDSCTPVDDGGSEGGTGFDRCRARGGCYVDIEPKTRCDFDHLMHFDPRRQDNSYMGFRCCAD